MSLMEATLGEEIFPEQMVVERPAIPANTQLIIGFSI
jgi:arsenate reductase-like glutaredoxin family protein